MKFDGRDARRYIAQLAGKSRSFAALR